MQAHDEESGTNESGNPRFADILDAHLTRRQWFKLGASAGVVSFLGASHTASAYTTTSPSPLGGIGFASVPVVPITLPQPDGSRPLNPAADAVVVPAGYTARVLYAWGDPVSNDVAPWSGTATESIAHQERSAGAHHDGGHYFGFPVRQGTQTVESSERGLWACNHEYVDHGLLFPDGEANWSLDKVRKSQAAHGLSVVEVRKSGGVWSVVRPSAFGRRVTANSPVRFGGPAAGSDLLKTLTDPTGLVGKGTINNCAHGSTPWGTYLTCEENWNGYFGFVVPNPNTGEPLKFGDVITVAQRDAINAQLAIDLPVAFRRYGLGGLNFGAAVNGNVTFNGYAFGYRWDEFDPRFDCNRDRNEPNKFGYVVEVDPLNPNAVPVKRTALGRFKHENAQYALTEDKRVVMYMGCDEVNEYIYKFVSRDAWNPSNRAANANLLDHGTLYVAKFNEDGTGEWKALVIGANGLAAPNTVWPGGPVWSTDDQICVYTRQAADRAGATMMDRPEWIAVHPVSREVYITMTNNSRRGNLPPSANAPDGATTAAAARPSVDGPNPRAGNLYGHLLRWRETNADPAATTFEWEVFVKAGPGATGDTRTLDLDSGPGVVNITTDIGDIDGDVFGAPDGLWFDRDGRLWIQTDLSTGNLDTDGYTTFGNNAMLAADPRTRQVRRFLIGPTGCEVTGMNTTPDRRTMFVNIQHPGEPITRFEPNPVTGQLRVIPAPEENDPANPSAFSAWPANAGYGPGPRPRSATIVITKNDGGVIGT